MLAPWSLALSRLSVHISSPSVLRMQNALASRSDARAFSPVVNRAAVS